MIGEWLIVVLLATLPGSDAAFVGPELQQLAWSAQGSLGPERLLANSRAAETFSGAAAGAGFDLGLWFGHARSSDLLLHLILVTLGVSVLGVAKMAAPEPRKVRAGRQYSLCLSGGGYRAALFHLGALRRLHETGILPQVAKISSVSGGSLLMGFLATRSSSAFKEHGLDPDDFEREIAQPFRDFVKGDRRTWQALQNLTVNLVLRDRRLSTFIADLERSFGSKTLGELPKQPEIVFCATDLGFGVNWIFRRKKDDDGRRLSRSNDGSGSYRAGYVDLDSWSIARCAAISASFPPIFGPYRLGVPADKFIRRPKDGRDRDDAIRDNLHLSDGGIYDNLGLEPIWPPVEGSTLLISDAGAPFEFRASSRLPWRMIHRYLQVSQVQAQKLRHRSVIERKAMAGEDFEYAEWRIGVRHRKKLANPEPASFGYHDGVVGRIERIRTDLDHFSEAEAQILENHGYACAERSLAYYLPSHLSGRPEPRLPHAELDPSREGCEPTHVVKALSGSHKRFSFSRWFAAARPSRPSTSEGPSAPDTGTRAEAIS
ncbi:MAG: patatin-like phospholipase family protein [Thermoanaerobaculia bacterium]|nr:patatin-like phospholipase family protein [Thermoanaerobaculia bacterium]